MFKELDTLSCIFEEPYKEFGVREFARTNNISPGTASVQLNSFFKKKLLKQRKERQNILYKANLESEEYTDIKIFYSIRKIRNSGLIKELNKEYIHPTIILFGSTSTGLDDKTSDIDICIISPEEKSLIQKASRIAPESL